MILKRNTFSLRIDSNQTAWPSYDKGVYETNEKNK